jgi:hypothetical protein
MEISRITVFNAVTNSELTELVPVFTIRPAFPTSIKKVNTSFKNVWRTWGPALPMLLADLMIFRALRRPTAPASLKKKPVGRQRNLGLTWTRVQDSRHQDIPAPVEKDKSAPHFLSNKRDSEFLKFVGPIGPRGRKIMRSANNIGNAGPHVRQTFLNDVFTFLGLFSRKYHLAHQNVYSNIFIFITVANNIYQKQIKYHV